MVTCPYCGKKMPVGNKTCPDCMMSPRKAERRIPIASAIIAIVFCAVVVFGAALAFVSRIGATSDDVGLHIDGTWEIETPTYNDEHITFVFTGDSFSRFAESMIFDASPEVIGDIREFHMMYSQATVDAEYMGDGNFFIQIATDGTFALDGNNILLVSGEGLARLLPFYWESEAIIINGDRFIRR